MGGIKKCRRMVGEMDKRGGEVVGGREEGGAFSLIPVSCFAWQIPKK